MMIRAELNKLFEDMLANRGTKRKRKALQRIISVDEVDILLEKVIEIGDPADYANDQETYVPVKQFFEFVDFVSGVIIMLGPTAKEKIIAYPDTGSLYIPWVKKYVLDERFHRDLIDKLS